MHRLLCVLSISWDLIYVYIPCWRGQSVFLEWLEVLRLYHIVNNSLLLLLITSSDFLALNFLSIRWTNEVFPIPAAPQTMMLRCLLRFIENSTLLSKDVIYSSSKESQRYMTYLCCFWVAPQQEALHPKDQSRCVSLPCPLHSLRPLIPLSLLHFGNLSSSSGDPSI